MTEKCELSYFRIFHPMNVRPFHRKTDIPSILRCCDAKKLLRDTHSPHSWYPILRSYLSNLSEYFLVLKAAAVIIRELLHCLDLASWNEQFSGGRIEKLSDSSPESAE